jgi:hypothetical protein
MYREIPRSRHKSPLPCYSARQCDNHGTVASAVEIPYPLIAVVAEVFSKQYTHTEIDSRFYYANFPPKPPDGNKQQKCHDWLRLGNRELPRPLSALGKLLEELMESVPPTEWWDGESPHPSIAHRERINRQLMLSGWHTRTVGTLFDLGRLALPKPSKKSLAPGICKAFRPSFNASPQMWTRTHRALLRRLARC